MTPKEKAKELVDKFYDTTDDHWDQDWVSKKCALIAVEELIYETQFEVPNIRQRWWQDVKQHIQRL